MEFRKSTLNDIDRIMQIFSAARKRIASLGINQWQNGYPNMDSTLQDIHARISRVLVDENNYIIATAAVYVGNEPTYDEIFDGEWLTESKTYGIIHRIAVDTTSKNKGAASRMMAYCAEISRTAGMTSMRCDTHFGNVIMQHTLEKNGYIRCGTIYLADGQTRVAYEKLI